MTVKRLKTIIFGIYNIVLLQRLFICPMIEIDPAPRIICLKTLGLTFRYVASFSEPLPRRSCYDPRDNLARLLEFTQVYKKTLKYCLVRNQRLDVYVVPYQIMAAGSISAPLCGSLDIT